mgnify:CR=1 FL=1
MAAQPTLKQLRYLCQLAYHQHFGRAAEASNISQSTLSAAINELEDILNAALVERSNKHVIITELGKQVVARAEAILTDVEDLSAACKAASQPFGGSIRLGVIPTVAPFILPKLVKNLREQEPQFKLFIREDKSAGLTQALRNGELDVLLLALPYACENSKTMHLFNDRFVLAYPKGNELEQRKNLQSQDLRKQPLLLLEDGHCLRDHALAASQLRSDEISIPFEATSLNTIVQMVANGIGVTLLPQLALDTGILHDTAIKTRELPNKEGHREIGLMWRKRSPREKEYRLLGELIQRYFAK